MRLPPSDPRENSHARCWREVSVTVSVAMGCSPTLARRVSLLGVTLALLLTVWPCWAAPTLQWSFQAEGEVVSSPCLADIDGDQVPEVLFGSCDSRLYALRGADGSHVWPWPQELVPGAKIYGSPAVADLDGDGQPEVVVGCEDTGGAPWGWVYVWRSDGTIVPGWPQPTGPVLVSPALGDLDGDDQLEIVVSSTTVYAFRPNGSLLPGQWPLDTGSTVRSSPALADVDGDGLPEVAVGTDQACLVHLLNWDGSEVPGWPYSTEERQLCYVPGSPALGDLDGDGQPEVIFGSDTHGIYVVDGDGRDLPGWPLWAGNWVASSPALADFGNDHHLEVVIGCADRLLYLLRDDGSLMPGWPQATGGEVLSNPALGDVDRDGDIDIVVGTLGYASSQILAFDVSGQRLWELPVGGNLISSPALGDVDGDGRLELLIGCRELNTLLCYDLGPSTYDPDKLPWPMFHRDALHTGLYPDLGPVVEVIAPDGGEVWSGVQTIVWQAWGEGLHVDIAWSGDAGEVWNGITWGIANTGTYVWDTSSVPDGWSYLMRVEAYGEGLSGWDTSDGTFTVKNEHEPVVELLHPLGGEVLGGEAEIQWLAQDADGDTLTMNILCRPDSLTPWHALEEGFPNDGLYLWATEEWPDGSEYVVRVRAFDGIYWGEDSSDCFGIYNPDPPYVELVYPNGGEYLEGSVSILYEASDPDGEALAVHADCSPDGQDWLPIASDQPDTGGIPWATDSFPNASSYLLRVGASDSLWTVWDTCDAPFAVYNNHPPEVSFVHPAAGDSVAGDVDVTWTGQDLDGDLLSFWLRARRAVEQWDTLAQAIEETVLVWATSGYPDGSCQLAVRARDPGDLWSDEATVDVCIDNQWPPTIALLHPIGGETLSGRDTVRWTTSDPDSQPLLADVQLSRRDSTWALGESVLGDSLLWDTHLYPDATDYSIRVTVEDTDGLSASASSGHFTVDNPYPPTVVLLWPVGGIVLTGEVTIQWAAQDPDHEPLTVDILLRDSPLSMWTAIVAGLSNEGIYTWDTRDWPDGEQYELKLLVTDGTYESSDSTSSPFTIWNPTGPIVNVVYPNGGETVRGTAEVRWAAVDPHGAPLTIDLHVSLNWGQDWYELASGEPNDSCYQWDTTGHPDGDGYLMMVVAASDSQTGTDTSDAPFSVDNPHPPTVCVQRPLDDDVVSGRYPIRWLAQDEDGDSLLIDIDLTTDSGASWLPVVRGASNRGIYIWDTTPLQWSPQCKLRVTARDDSFEVWDISDEFLVTNACSDLSAVIVYPNPCFVAGPRRGPLVFQNLTPAATITIVDVAARRCARINERDGDGRAQWNLTTDGGLPCKAGLYFYRISSSDGETLRGRVVVVR